MNLTGKVVIVTGSSSGIGKTTAIRFAKEGCKVVVNYSKNKEGGEETLEEIKKITPDCLLVQADVSKEADVKKLFESVVDKFKTVDILINNAAIGTDKKPFMEASYDDWKDMIDTDITSVFMCSQHAAKIMQKQGYGKILNTSSVRGWGSGGRTPVYAAMKAAVNNFTKHLPKWLPQTFKLMQLAQALLELGLTMHFQTR